MKPIQFAALLITASGIPLTLASPSTETDFSDNSASNTEAMTQSEKSAVREPDIQTGKDAEVVIVTARRPVETLKKLSFSANNISKEDLSLISATHAHEAFTRSPSTWISRNSGQEQLTAIRSPVFTGPGSCAEFLMMEDGIALRPVGLCNVNQLFEAHTEQASQITVVPSSADAWFGNSGLHGVININSAIADGENKASLEAGSHDFYRGMVKVSEKDRYVLTATATTDGGFMEDAGVDQQKLNLRWLQTIDGWQANSVLSLNNLNQETAGYVTGFEAYKDYGLRRKNNDPDAYRDAFSMRFHSRMEKQLENGMLQLTPYLRSSQMQFRMHFLPGDPIEENKQNSFGLMAFHQFNKQHFTISSGLDMEMADIALQQYQQAPSFSPNFPVGDQYDYEVLAWRFSPFAQLELKMSDSSTIDAGLRFETVFYDYDNQLSDGSACPPPTTAANCRYFRPADDTDRFAELSPNIGFRQQINKQLQWFTHLARGYRAPETSEMYRLQQGQTNTNLDSVTSDQLELGLRYEHNGLNLYPALFYNQKQNVIFQDSQRRWVNDAETEHYGLELAFDWLLNADWLINGNYTIARHRYRNNPDLLGTSLNIEDNDIDTAPRNMGNLFLQWQASPNDKILLQAEYIGKYYTDPENLHSYEGHKLLHFSWQHSFSPTLDLNFRIHNLLDEAYAERADFSGFSGDRYFVGMNTSYYLRMDYRF